MIEEISADLEATLFPELREITNMTDASTEEMHNVCNYIGWATYSHLNLKFTLTPSQLDQCSVSWHHRGYQEYHASLEYALLGSYEYLLTLVELTKILTKEITLNEASTFTKYYKGSDLPKFILLSAHSETLQPILTALDFKQLLVPPSAMILVNYYKDLELD